MFSELLYIFPRFIRVRVQDGVEERADLEQEAKSDQESQIFLYSLLLCVNRQTASSLPLKDSLSTLMHLHIHCFFMLIFLASGSRQGFHL